MPSAFVERHVPRAEGRLERVFAEVGRVLEARQRAHVARRAAEKAQEAGEERTGRAKSGAQ